MHIPPIPMDPWSISPQVHFADLSPEVTAAAIAAGADVTLVLDAQGVIRDVALNAPSAELAACRQWVGRRWVDTVSVESRIKLQELMQAALQATLPWTSAERQVNHPMSGGLELPISYRVVPLQAQQQVLAVGRNWQAQAALQQRLVDAQQSLERDYLRLRHTESRYRLLFESVEEALFVIDASTGVVIEHNPAALRLLGDSASRRIVGRTLAEWLAPTQQSTLEALLAQARLGGRAEADDLQWGGTGLALRGHASVFRQDNATLLLLRLVPQSGQATVARAAPNDADALAKLLDHLPEAFVLTDPQGRVLAANPAFTAMAQVSSSDPVVGQALDRWLGRSAVDLGVIIANLRQHGALRLFPTTLRSGYADSIDIELSAVAITDGPSPCFGFAIRDVSRRLPAGPVPGRQLPRTADQLTGLVGRLPLKDIVGETTDLIERLCIEAALQLTRDNRASAAEMLGLSRQSLYVKLRRYGMQGASEPAGDEEQPA